MALVAMMSVSFVSCKDKAAEPTTEETNVEVEAPATEEAAPVTADTVAVDTTAATPATPAAAPAH